ncbi:microtubule-associated protein futsch-like [Hordeum vulgare]|nr:microtubule-associated protein futsch-like [Hordeum vulgare]
MVVTPSPSRWAAPLPAAAPGRPHPTYTDMITYSLAQLGGASARSAIAGFIAARFTSLPVSHDALLSAHLRRLVAEGVLCNSGFSYLLSTNINPDIHSGDQSTTGLLGQKRKSWRPIIIDKQLPHVHPPAPAPAPAPAAGSWAPLKRPSSAMSAETEAARPSTVIKRGRGRPRKDKPPAPAATMLDETEAVDATGIKRGRGRPRKDKPPAPAATMLDETEAVDATGIKRGRGRPRKDKPPAAPMLAETQAGDAGPAAVIKRGRGRPRKDKPPAAAAAAMLAETQAGDAGPAAGIKRGRGRPRKDKPAAQMSAETQAGKQQQPAFD